MKVDKALLRDVAYAVGQAACLAYVVYLLLGGIDRDLGAPVRFARDSLAYLTQTKTTLDYGWWWVNPRLSAPFSFNELLFPSNSTVDQAFVLLLRPFTRDIGLVANLAWIGLVALSGVTATYGMRSLGVSVPSALAMGSLFALSPYAVYRNLEHFMLVTYLVPFSAAAAVAVAAGFPGNSASGPARIVLLVGCLLTGFNYAYYAFFGCVLLGFATLAASIGRRDVRATLFGIVCITAIALSTAINLVPSLRAWSVDGKPALIQEKLPAEAEVYGLKVRHLISPLAEHSFAPFVEWNEHDAWARFPLETENTTGRMGLVGSLGFIVALLTVLGAGYSPADAASRVRMAAGVLTVGGVLFATIGGFGSLFNLFVAPDIRGYSRITPFLAFFALLVVGLLCDRIRRLNNRGGVLVLASLLLLGLWDQSQPFKGLRHQAVSFQHEYRHLERLVQQVEVSLPVGSRVLQLPFTIYLNDPGRFRMGIYDQFKPYLASHHLAWSFPALANAHFLWQQAAAGLPLMDLPFVMRREGFSAIWVDTYGYEDSGIAAIEALSSATGVQVKWSNERYVVLDIRTAQAGPSALHVPPLTRPPIAIDGNLRTCDLAPAASIDYVGGESGPFAGGVRVAADHSLRVAGWIVAPGSNGTAAAVDLLIDGVPIHTYYGFPRADVASALGGRQYENSGFVALVPADRLPPGPHALSLRALSGTGACASATPPINIVAH